MDLKRAILEEKNTLRKKITVHVTSIELRLSQSVFISEKFPTLCYRISSALKFEKFYPSFWFLVNINGGIK